jgi:protein-tyrosine-phosphatase
MAEAIFKHHTKAISRIGRVDSAGAGDLKHLLPTDGRTLRTLLRHKVDVTWRYPRPIIPEDYSNFHYILAVDQPTLNRLNQLQKSWGTFGSSNIQLLGKYSRTGVEEVIDPFMRRESEFEEVFSQLTNLCVMFLRSVIGKENDIPTQTIYGN